MSPAENVADEAGEPLERPAVAAFEAAWERLSQQHERPGPGTAPLRALTRSTKLHVRRSALATAARVREVVAAKRAVRRGARHLGRRAAQWNRRVARRVAVLEVRAFVNAYGDYLLAALLVGLALILILEFREAIETFWRELLDRIGPRPEPPPPSIEPVEP